MLFGELKLHSIFEEHTELLKRGKASKPIEFGHVVHFQQVHGRHITAHEVLVAARTATETRSS